MKNIFFSGLLCCALLLSSTKATAQTFFPVWNHNMPNSKGVSVKDSIANERIYKVANPGVYTFLTSKAENKHAAVLIIPGGGYVRLAYEISGFQLAKWFNTIGVNAFVLAHRFPQSPDVKVSYKAPLQDGQRALRYIRAHAKDYQIDMDKIGVMGCSTGGHLSASLSTIGDDWSLVGDSLDTYSCKPNFSILISPVISMDDAYVHKGSRENLLGKSPSQELKDIFSCDKQVSAATPPAFLVHAMNDTSVSCMNSILYFSALKKQNLEGSALYIFPAGKHSIALRNNPLSTNSWPELAELWLKEIGIIK